MTARTDIHRPVATITEDYKFLFADDAQRPALDDRSILRREMARTKMTGPTADRGFSQCHHCGAHMRYYAILLHVPTNTTIAVGETCLDNRFSLATSEFQSLRRQAALDRQAQRIKTAATEAIAAIDNEAVRHALARETDLAALGLTGWGLNTFSDIRRKLWNYGNLSDRQVALLVRLLGEIPERQAREAERAAEVEVPAPSGRVTFSGVVVSRKWHDNDFGGAMKMTVKVTTDAGIYLVWVTEPRNIDPEVGDTVSLTATLSPSSDKPHFAFGKRPSKATVVSRRSDDELPSALD